MNTEKNTEFKEWVVLELMGHRRIFGLLTEQEIAGNKFLRIEVPDAAGKMTTQFYNPSSVYCMTPTTEEIVKAAAHNNAPTPVHLYELEMPKTEPKQDPQPFCDELGGGDANDEDDSDARNMGDGR